MAKGAFTRLLFLQLVPNFIEGFPLDRSETLLSINALCASTYKWLAHDTRVLYVAISEQRWMEPPKAASSQPDVETPKCDGEEQHSAEMFRLSAKCKPCILLALVIFGTVSITSFLTIYKTEGERANDMVDGQATSARNAATEHAHGRHIREAGQTAPNVPEATREPARNRSKRQPDPEAKKAFIVEMMKFAWDGYAKYAWGHNELKPNSRSPHNGGVFKSVKLGGTIIDAMDTLYIMGLTDRYEKARSFVADSFDVNILGDFSLFETNIRLVGGFLSMYGLTKDKMFLDKARQVADKLLDRKSVV